MFVRKSNDEGETEERVVLMEITCKRHDEDLFVQHVCGCCPASSYICQASFYLKL